MRVTEKETRILKDIANAAGKAMPTDFPEREGDVSKAALRQILPCFDLFRIVMSDNRKAMERVMGTDPGAAAAYKEKLSPSLGTAYTPEEVYALHGKCREALKDAIAQDKQPARQLYIADQHFYHDRLCMEMDRRGFSGYEEMNAHMVSRWNRKVNPRDDVYILGDFSVARGEATNKALAQLNGKKHLIVGNHDKYLADKEFDRSLFRSIDAYREIRDHGRTVVLSHYPVFCYHGQYRRDKSGSPMVYMLYGHTHNTHDEVLVDRFIAITRQTRAASRHRPEPEPIPCNMINCFCMFSDYQPMTLDEWIQIDRKRREVRHEG